MRKIIFGAAKDKGGWISVRDNEVVVEDPSLIYALQKIFGLMNQYSCKAYSYEGALNIVNSAIEKIINAKHDNRDIALQTVLETLVKIRRSILQSEASADYEEFGIEVHD
jgi:hypothetical protein